MYIQPESDREVEEAGLMMLRIWLFIGWWMLSLSVGCNRSDSTMITPVKTNPQPANANEATATLGSTATDLGPVCPPARGIGTVAPAISIVSITIDVNGIKQEVGPDGILKANPGDIIRIIEVIVCSEPTMVEGGRACVDFAPVGSSGKEIMTEHQGSHLVPVQGGFFSIPGPDYTWISRDDWIAFAAVVNHWTPGETQDLGCANGLCERDDRIIIPVIPPEI